MLLFEMRCLLSFNKNIEKIFAENPSTYSLSSLGFDEHTLFYWPLLEAMLILWGFLACDQELSFLQSCPCPPPLWLAEVHGTSHFAERDHIMPFCFPWCCSVYQGTSAIVGVRFRFRHDAPIKLWAYDDNTSSRSWVISVICFIEGK